MKQSKFSEERIAYVLRQAEGGTSVFEVCRQNGISEQTFYRCIRPESTRSMLDFMPDTLGSGPRIRVLTIVDHFSRVSPAIEVNTSLSGRRVIEILERAAGTFGLPKTICVDNGPEFRGRALDQ